MCHNDIIRVNWKENAKSTRKNPSKYCYNMKLTRTMRNGAHFGIVGKFAFHDVTNTRNGHHMRID